MPKVFLDISVLVYASDHDSPEKMRTARALMQGVAAEGGGVISTHILWQVSFPDALILRAAERASCSIVYSEDLNPGRLYGGVEVRDPFSDR